MVNLERFNYIFIERIAGIFVFLGIGSKGEG
jgi:hypothetical protein